MKLYVSDLDGTLLRNDATLSPYSQEQLNRLIREGVHFTVASARSVVTMQHILKGVDMKLPVIEFNGAFISDIRTGNHQVVNSIETETVEDIFELLEHRGYAYFVSSFNGKEDCLYYSDRANANEGMRWYYRDRIEANDKRLRYRRDLRETSGEQIVCFTVIDRKQNLQELYETARRRYAGLLEIYFYENRYSPGWHWLTVHHRKATKAEAVRQLLDQYGFKREQLTVFGDQINDVKMFRLAGRAIAVANAAEELKRLASKVIGTNEEDSVVRFMVEDHMSKED